ncbi:MAG: acetolactate synthase small subunit [Lachnospiraceae bacterium]|nr:acetolactate synthase small subunit [Lachnospiraceae bacterium]
MTSHQQLFTLTIYSEHCVGLLNQVSIIFTRRCLNIEDVSASRTSIKGIHRLTITVWSDRDTMEKVVKQIEKRIDVLRAFLYTDSDIIYQEIALYKVDTDKLMKERRLESLIRHHGARILEITPEFTVVEKAGQPWETEALLEELEPLGLRQFVRSGRVCVTKSSQEHLNLYLQEQELRRQAIEMRQNNE